jgi:hypothetical protein
VIPDWWTSAEPTHSDYVTLAADKILTMRTGSAWRELDLAWPEPTVAQDNGNIVVFADFKPTNDAK